MFLLKNRAFVLVLSLLTRLQWKNRNLELARIGILVNKSEICKL